MPGCGPWRGRGLRSPGSGCVAGTFRAAVGVRACVRVERAGDNAGAIGGPLLASALVALVVICHAMFVAITVAARQAARQARRVVASPTAPKSA